MKESDYNKWLEEKCSIENFDKLSEPLKKAIYKAEQELTDNEEVDFTGITLYEDGEYMELNFKWWGYHLECIRTGRVIFEMCEHDEDKNPDDDEFYEIGEESVERAGFEVMTELLSDYIHPHSSNDEIQINLYN